MKHVLEVRGKSIKKNRSLGNSATIADSINKCLTIADNSRNILAKISNRCCEITRMLYFWNFPLICYYTYSHFLLFISKL